MDTCRYPSPRRYSSVQARTRSRLPISASQDHFHIPRPPLKTPRMKGPGQRGRQRSCRCTDQRSTRHVRPQLAVLPPRRTGRCPSTGEARNMAKDRTGSRAAMGRSRGTWAQPHPARAEQPSASKYIPTRYASSRTQSGEKARRSPSSATHVSEVATTRKTSL